MKTDYLVLGSGLAGLSFAALMAQAGKKVVVIEAHDVPGGYGHTFTEGPEYKFNAQLHYVWSCGEGQIINQFLKKLKLDQEVTFESYDHHGYDHMRMPGFALDIPGNLDVLIQRLQELFPEYQVNIRKFIETVKDVTEAIERLPSKAVSGFFISNPNLAYKLLKFQKATLQDVFDMFKLPLEAQTLLALQWPDFMLPPRDLSFFAWAVLFVNYCRGAYYPSKHFSHVVESLVQIIKKNEGEIFLNSKVVEFKREEKRITGVVVEDLLTGTFHDYFGNDVICNMDPKKAAEMIGFKFFSPSVQKQLMYDYSPSSFVAYCAVKDLNLAEFGFGRWNLFHSEQKDLNQAFDDMYLRADYSKPSFVMTTPGFFSENPRRCPKDCQIIEFLTVANFDKFHDLKLSDGAQYRNKKKEILESILTIVERDYIPDLSRHLVFKITGSPTTNQRFCGSPAGNSYGSNLTPNNMNRKRLKHKTSLDHFYFCNASSGYPGFVGTIKTGSLLYEELSRDKFIQFDF